MKSTFKMFNKVFFWVLGSSEGKKTAKRGSKVDKFYFCWFWDILYIFPLESLARNHC